jgi:hypothetical protein
MAMLTHQRRGARPQIWRSGIVRREWVLGDGSSVHPAFDVLLPQDAGLTFNACRYHNVDLYRRPEWTQHANTVTAMEALICVAPDPKRLAIRFGEVLECHAHPTEGGFTLSFGGVAMEVLAPYAAASRFGSYATVADRAHYLGYRLCATDPNVVAAFAQAAGLEVRASREGIVLPPAAMFGNIVEIAAS